MHFKNLIAYRLNEIKGDLSEQLSRKPFEPCKPSDSMSVGFAPPRKENGAIVETINGHKLITLMAEEKVVPSDYLNRQVAEICKTIEQQQGFAPGRKQTKEIKENVLQGLLPNAPTRRRRTNVWIAPGFMFVDAATASKAEEVIECMRSCLDEFPIYMCHTNISSSSAMADWLAGGEAPNGFTIDRDCELKAIGEEKSAVRYVHHPLDGDETGDEIKHHLAAGKLPTKLALTWGDRVSFVLTEQFAIKRIALLDILKEQAENESECADDKFDADFTIQTGELIRLFNALVEAHGGFVKDEE